MEPQPQPAVFATTQWSVVLTAGKPESPQSAAALEQLCRAYWYPLYACVRRRGYSPEDARDLTQEFFARLIEKNFLADVARERGRFRSFLLAALKHLLTAEWRKSSAVKRGGGATLIPLDEIEQRFGAEPMTDEPMELYFDRRWARTILETALGNLKAEYAAAGKGAMFAWLKHYLTRLAGQSEYEKLAAQLQMTSGGVAVAVHRFRLRYRELVRAEIARTVSSEAEVEDEMRYLQAVLKA
jgi:DNA-directed RNA polymerase specialized sigma24 family protein